MGFFPDRRRDDQLSALHGPRRAQVAAGRSVHEGAGTLSAQTTRPIPSSPTRWSSTSAPIEPSLAGPKRPQDRVPLKLAKQMFREALEADLGRTGTLAGIAAAKQAMSVAASPQLSAVGRRDCHGRAGGRKLGGSGDDERQNLRPASRSRCDRGDHELHEHVEPERDARRGTARAKCSREGTQHKAVGEDSLAPGSKVVTDYFRKAGRDGRSRDSSGSTSSATDARRASATRVRCPQPIADAVEAEQARRRGGAVRQQKFRGTNQPAHAIQLSRVAAARCCICARGTNGHRLQHRAARASEATDRYSCATSGPRRRKSKTRFSDR